jgi:hypothetical protein
MPNTYFTRTPASTGNRRTWTWSGWIKRAKLGLDSANVYAKYNSLFYNQGAVGNNDDTLGFSIGSDDKLGIGTGYYEWLTTTQVFRDTSAWYHLMLVLDTTQATANDRVKIYVNGVQITSFSINNLSTYCVQNFQAGINTTAIHAIGSYANTNGVVDGSMASISFVDGQALTPSSFGETDATTGIWKFKSYSGSYGTNGFFLKFENSASLGTDSSGNGNNFTVNGTPTQTVDTPSNVFATGNPLNNYYAPATFSNGNLTVVTASGNPSWTFYTGNFGVSTGKWYWEIKLGTANSTQIGISALNSTSTSDQLGESANQYAYQNGGSIRNSGAAIATYSTYTTNDIIGFALDATNNKLYFSKNGTWQNSAVPSAGTGGISISQTSTATGWWFPAFGDGNTTSDTYNLNFGNGYFGTTVITSPNSDGAGLGKFQYAVPSGYYSLCTKNINLQG